MSISRRLRSAPRHPAKAGSSGLRGMLSARNRVMVFGVFDGLHAGHQYFLTYAATYGSLIVVIAPDLAVQQLKQKTPRHSERERVAAIKTLMPEATVILGDERQGTYRVVKTHRPAMILLGHDQRALGDDLRRAMASGALPDIPCRSLPQKPA